VTSSSRRAGALGLAALLGLAGCQLPRLPGGARAQEQRAYREALARRASDPAAAAAGLEAFLAAYPRSPLADDAGLWLAEIQLERGDETGALRALARVVERHPLGDRTDLARLRLARLQERRGHLEAARKTLDGVRLARLDEGGRREALELQARLAAARGEGAAQLIWLARLHQATPEDDARELLEAEIDRTVARLPAADLARAADQLPDGTPALRVRLRLAELAVARGELSAARDELRRARALPTRPADDERLAALERCLGLREPEARQALPPPLADLGRVAFPDAEHARGVLGVALPLTGAYAPLGEESLQGILLAAGLPAPPRGASASGVRLLVRDTQSSAAGAERAVDELSREPELSAIVGPLALAETEGAARAARRLEVPLLSLSRRLPEAGDNPWEFRLGLAPEDEARRLADYAVDELGARRFAILYPRDRYGSTLEGLFWDAVEARGGEVVAVAAYDPDATDFSEAIRRLVGYTLLSRAEEQAIAERDRLLDRAKRLPPREARELREKAAALRAPDGSALPPVVDFEVLFVPDSHENVVLLAPQLAFHGVEGVHLLGASGWNHPDLVRIGQQHVEGAVFTAAAPGADAPPLLAGFTEGFARRFGGAPDGFAAGGFDAANAVLGRWIEGARSREEVRDALAGLRDQPGASGVYTIGDDGRAVRRPLLLRVADGRIVTLEP
jgi:ABC-type branched-subunit amino acid transport system substrate-binding protein